MRVYYDHTYVELNSLEALAIFLGSLKFIPKIYTEKGTDGVWYLELAETSWDDYCDY